MKHRFFPAAALVALLPGCGGGSGGESAAVPVVAAPAPSPTPNPTPAPTPTPSASPTPSAPPLSGTAPASAGALRFPAIAAARARTGIALPVGKCLNYAGQLEVKSDPSWMRPVTDSDFAEMKAQGFATLRVMVNFERYTAAGAPYAIDPAFMARVKHVVDAATAAGLNVMLENHVSDDLRADLAGQKPRFNAIWTQVATTFRDAPASVWFELLNEPRDQIGNADLPGLYNPAIAAIRKTNPTRPVIVNGAWWAAIGGMEAMTMPDDPYVVPTFHYYSPIEFTHQGAPFMTPVLPTGVTWGSDPQYAQLSADVARVKAYMDKTGRVPILGEYGVYEGVPLAQRARYMDDVSHAFASVGVASCAYGYVNAFPIRTKTGWITEITSVLGSPL